MGYNAQAGISPQIVAGFVNKTIDEFANTYFAAIPDQAQRLQAAEVAVRNAGYAIGRGRAIYLPQVKKPDVEFATTKAGDQYLRMKGKLNPTNPQSKAGISAMIFTSKYGPEFSVSMMMYGLQNQQQGQNAPQFRVNVRREDILFNPDGSVAIVVRFFPDKTAQIQAKQWIMSAVLPPAGTRPAGAPAGAPAQTVPGRAECFGFYAPTEPECAQCGDQGACAQETMRTQG